MTASKAFAVAVDGVSSYSGSVLDEADFEAALADVAVDLLGEDLAAEAAAALDFDRCPCWRAWHRKWCPNWKSKNRGLLKDCEGGAHKHPFEPVALPVHGCWQPFLAVAFAETKPDSGSRANLGWDSSLAWMKNYVSLL